MMERSLIFPLAGMVQAKQQGGNTSKLGGRRLRKVTITDYLESLVNQTDGELSLSVVEVGKSKSREPERYLLALKLPSGEVVKDGELVEQSRHGSVAGASYQVFSSNRVYIPSVVSTLMRCALGGFQIVQWCRYGLLDSRWLARPTSRTGWL